MKTGTAPWTRRRFLQAGAAVSGATVAFPASALAAAPRVFAIVASPAGASGGVLRSFRVGESSWALLDEVDLPARVHLAMHPALPMVYACHNVAEWGNLPRAAVGAWRIDRESGVLTPAGTQPLSLAATHPRFAVVTADGSSLVTGTAAGIYNVLPLGVDGSLQSVAAMRKEHGRMHGGTAMVASPRAAVAHRDGTILAVDDGQQTLSRFRVEPDGLVLLHRLHLPGATGARQLAVSRCGQWAYVRHGNDGAISVHRIASRQVLPALQAFPGAAGVASIEMCPGGHALLRADAAGVSRLRLCAQTGRILGASMQMDRELRQVKLLPDGHHVAGVDATREELLLLSLSSGAHRRPGATAVARVPGCTGVAFCSV